MSLRSRSSPPLPSGFFDLADEGSRPGLGPVRRVRRTSDGAELSLLQLDGPARSDPRFGAYLLAVAGRLQHVTHPAIAPVVASGELDGRVWVASRPSPGRTLRAVLGDGPLPPRRAIDLLEPLARGLSRAADYGLRHHDLDAANVQVGVGDRVALLEAAFIDPLAVPGAREARPDLLAYLPPERLRLAPPDDRTDAHLIGGLLLTAITGHPPGPDAQRALRDRDRAGAVAPELELVLWRALAADPLQRPASPRDLFFQARLALDGRPPERFIGAPQRSVTGAPAASTDLVRASGPEPTSRPRAGAARLSGRVAAAWAATSTSAERIARDVAGAAGRLRRAPRTAPPTAAAPRPAAAPAPLPPPGGSPTGLPATPDPVERRRRTIISVAAAVGLVAGAGAVLAGRADDGADRPAPAARTTTQGELTLTHPQQWQPVDPAPPVLGVRLNDPVALEPRGVRDFVPGSATLVAGRWPTGDPGRLPAGLAAQLSTPPRREPIRAGELEGYRYRALTRRDGQGIVDLYVFGTDRGPLAVACFAGTEVNPAYRRQCGVVAGTLKVTGARPVALGGSPAYGAALSEVLRDLDGERLRLRRQLRAAPTANAQTDVIAALAGAYRTAGDRLAVVRPVPAISADHEALVRQLRLIANGYTRLAAAAQAGNREAFNRARAQVRGRELRLDVLLRGLGDSGYLVR